MTLPTLTEFGLLSLATWRLSYMLVYEQGFMDSADTVRYILSKWWATQPITECLLCASVWVSAVLVALYALVPYGAWVIVWLAVSGVVGIVHKLLSKDS